MKSLLKVALLAGTGLLAQSVTMHRGIQYRLEGGRIHCQEAPEKPFTAKNDWPSLVGDSTGSGPTSFSWDGTLAYRLYFDDPNTAWIQCGFPMGLTQERRVPIWFWRPPVKWQGKSKLLGGWDGCALLAVPIWEPASRTSTPEQLRGWGLTLVDLGDGETREVFRQLTPNLPMLQSVMVEGEALVFASNGTAVRVDCMTKQARVLSEDFWKGAGMVPCKDPGAAPNPRIFGRPFLDRDGAVLFPVEPKVEIDEGDVQRAWSRLDEIRRKELIDQGYWPWTPGKVAGWKGQATFLRFDPMTGRWGTLPEDRVRPWIHQVDRNFICTEFTPVVDTSTAFIVEGGKVIRFEDRQVEHRVGLPVHQGSVIDAGLHP